MMNFIRKIIDMFLGDKSNEEKSVSHDIGVLDDSPKDTVGKKIGNTVLLKRTYFSKGVHGELIFPSGESIYTLERPWKDNEVGESCIPEGVYKVGMRPSPIVERTSRGEFVDGWEIQEVPGRTYIMIHIGNYVKNSDGCVLTGTTKSFQGSVPVVWQSGKAFNKFMKLMDEENIEAIEITRT